LGDAELAVNEKPNPSWIIAENNYRRLCPGSLIMNPRNLAKRSFVDFILILDLPSN
jgi:hypothetical protein